MPPTQCILDCFCLALFCVGLYFHCALFISDLGSFSSVHLLPSTIVRGPICLQPKKAGVHTSQMIFPQFRKYQLTHCAPLSGRAGPRQKNWKNLNGTNLFAVLYHKNDLEKVWKSRNEFELVGFKVEKNYPVLAILGVPKMALWVPESKF